MSKEIILPCQVFIKVMQCDCGGELVHVLDAKSANSDLPKYRHICNKCGKIKYLDNYYPRLKLLYQLEEK